MIPARWTHAKSQLHISILVVPVFLLVWNCQPIAAPAPQYNPLPTGESVYLSDNGVSRWSITTGALLWNRLENRQTFAPVVADKVLYIGSSDGLYALDAVHGTLKWKFPDANIVYTPTVENGIAYSASQDGVLRAHNGSNGAILWQRQFPGWIYPPTLNRGVLLTGGSASTLWAVSAADGHILWQRQLPQEMVHRPTLFDNNRAVITTFSGEVMAYAINNGDLLWNIQLLAPAFSPVSGGDALYLAGMDSTLHALDPGDGSVLWKYSLPEGIPPAHGNSLRVEGEWLIAIMDRSYMILDRRNGKMLLHEDVPGIPVGAPFLHNRQLWLFCLRANDGNTAALYPLPVTTHLSEKEM